MANFKLIDKKDFVFLKSNFTKKEDEEFSKFLKAHREKNEAKEKRKAKNRSKIKKKATRH